MLSLWCIIVVWAALFGLGTPLAWLLSGPSGTTLLGAAPTPADRPVKPLDHLLSPFLGMAAIVLILTNLVYLDIPVGRVTPFLWVGILLLWWALLRRRDYRAWLTCFPRVIFVAAAAVYLLHGLGLLLVGVHAYVGRGWLDGFHYVTLSEFFQHWPFGTAAEEISRDNLFLAWPMALKTDRIGQSLLHAFLASSCMMDAKPLFGVTILLVAPLTVLAIYGLARRIGLRSRLALVTAVGAGLSPALALIHLDCFLSQALATPLLLLFPGELEDLLERRGWRPLLRAALLLAGAGAIYTEILPLFWGLVCLTAVIHLARWPIPWTPAIRLAGLAGLALALNPGYVPYFINVMRRASAAGACFDTYAISLANWSRLWLGDLPMSGLEWSCHALQVCTLGLTGLAYLGLMWACRLSPGRTSLTRNIGILALVVIPIVVLLKDDQHPYAFYKLSMSIVPLLLLGLAVLARVRSRRVALVPLLLFAVWLSGAAATIQMVCATAGERAEVGSQASLMHGPDMRYLQSRLEATRGQDLVLALHHHYINGWLSYHGRHDHVHWLQPHPLLDKHGLGGVAARRGGDIVITLGAGFDRVDPGEMSLDWQGSLFRLWQAHSPRWAVPVLQVHLDGAGKEGRPPRWHNGNVTRLELLAGCDGHVTLNGKCVAALGLCRVQVCADQHTQELTSYGGAFEVTVPVKAGLNLVWLRLDPSHEIAQQTAPIIQVFGMTRSDSLPLTPNPSPPPTVSLQVHSFCGRGRGEKSAAAEKE